ncbi:MAG: hypothetical protein HZA90_02620 [Verrucomicrobia bacterium]|nr:hypothetical protein [Verrucomicrobiota bacterium]
MNPILAIATTSRFETALIFAVVILGFYWFVRIAKAKERQPLRLKTFFLGGATIGPEMTENNTVGLTFAWAGGTWFFVTVAYHNGPWVVLLQIPWVFSLVMLALLFRRILPATKDRTIHGFIRERYGVPSQKVAASATTLGYLINAGFEMFWASLMFAQCLGRPDLIPVVGILLAVIAGLYCSIGGYTANVRTDKIQNILGVLGLTVLAAAMLSTASTVPVLGGAIGVFCAGSLGYILLSMFLNKVPALKQNQTRISVAFAVVACVISVILIWFGAKHENEPVVTKFLSSTPMSPFLLFGLLSFQVVFNMVDMANWQSIAANGDVSTIDYREIKWSIVRGSLWLFWFPALGGSLIGCALRGVGGPLEDNTIFNDAFALVLPGGGELLRGLLLGVMFLGFISTSLSTVDNYVLAAAQTIWYDIVRSRQHGEILKAGDGGWQEERFVKNARRLLLPVSLAMVLLFWYLYHTYKGDVLNFQAVMYAWALVLFPPVIFALFLPKEKTEYRGWAVFFGMSVAVATVIVMFFYASRLPETDWRKNWFPNLMPLFAVGISLLFFGVGGWICSFWKKSPEVKSN